MLITFYAELLQITKQQGRIKGVDCSAQVKLNEEFAHFICVIDDKVGIDFAQCSFHGVIFFTC